jgi:hypothetical protein
VPTGRPAFWPAAPLPLDFDRRRRRIFSGL